MRRGERVIDVKTEELGTVRMSGKVDGEAVIIVSMDDGREVVYNPEDLDVR